MFVSVKLTKNSDLDKYKYISYNIGFDSHSEFLFTDKSYGKNAIICEADMSSSVHIDNEENYILILGEEPTQGLNDTALTAEAKHPINFTQSGKRCVLNLHYNGSNSSLFANTTKVYQFKPKNSEIKDYALCFRNASKYLKKKKTGCEKNRIDGSCSIFFC